jgi:NAD(P)-dependent dehydrogenase (short-subunit alcohol dehydrogenase family)
MTRPYGRHTTAEEVGRDADLRGRRAVLTGATSGFGAETARALAIAGADLVLAVRNVAAGEALAEQLAREASGRIEVLRLELADLASVAAFASRIEGPLDLLIANAGVSETPDSHLPNGLELRFATNHLGHFVLAHRLLPQMSARGARLVVLSSAAHKAFPVHLDDLQFTVRPFSPSAYSESKTANILFAQEAARRWAGLGVYANAVIPGSALTGLQRHRDEANMRQVGFIMPDGSLNPVLVTPGQAAATTVWAATAPELEGRGGLVLEACAEAIPTDDLRSWVGYNPAILDAETARGLWERSVALAEELMGQKLEG